MARWTPNRIARLGYLAGRGLSAEAILADVTLAAHSERAVRTAASKWHVPLGGPGTLALALSSVDQRRLDRAAQARGTTSAELALALLRIVMRDNLIKAVIDDGDHR
jgi:hypothetical protein